MNLWVLRRTPAWSLGEDQMSALPASSYFLRCVRLAGLTALSLGAVALYGCGGGGSSGGAPTANPDSYSVSQPLGSLNVSIPGVLANDGGSSLSASIASNSSCGNVTLNAAGDFNYTHTNTAGSCANGDSFTYRVSNSAGSSTGTVTLAIRPKANADSYLLSQPLDTLTVNAPGLLGNDIGANLSASLLPGGGTSCGTVSLATDGSFAYTHTTTVGTCATADSFQYRVSSSAGTSDSVTVTLNINQPPVPVTSNNCSQTGLNQTIGNPTAAFLSATDPEGQALTYSIVPGQAGTKGTAAITDPLTGQFTYTPFTDSRGTDEFTFEVTDGTLTAQGTFKVVYTPRIMPLGDSITGGEFGGGMPPGPLRVGYRKPLKDSLTAAGYEVDFVGTLSDGSDAGLNDAEHDGHGGWSADQIVDGRFSQPGAGKLLDWLPAVKPDVILLHIGTNDLTPDGDQSGQWPEVEDILEVIDSWETSDWPVTVVLAGIINRNPAATEFTVFNTNVFNSVASPRIGINDRLVWVDHESALTSAADYTDALHPNDQGYGKMSDVWFYPLTGEGPNPGSQFPASISAGFLPKCP